MNSGTFYNLLILALLPFLILRLFIRSRSNHEYRARFAERLGFGSPCRNQPLLIHAVSVGEVIAIAPVVNQLLDRYPDLVIVITTMTPTGAQLVRRLFNQRVHHRYIPWDTPAAVRRFINSIAPRGLIIVETEIWPNLVVVAHQRDIPVLLINGRLSDKSYRKYRLFKGLIRDTLEKFTKICVQFEPDFNRFIALGAKPESTQITGNVKYDAEADPALIKIGLEWKKQIGPRQVFLAASTHAQDDQVVLDAWLEFKKRTGSDALLVIVPRHPERFDPVYQSVVMRIEKSDFIGHVHRRSESIPRVETEVWVGDSLGELTAYYAFSDLAFIGGSFSGTGGHNPVEAGVLAKPIVMGPSQYNFEHVCTCMEKTGGLLTVQNAQQLFHLLEKRLNDLEWLGETGNKAQLEVLSQQGALRRLMESIENAIVFSSEHELP